MATKNTILKKRNSIKVGNALMHFDVPKIMGILNATPDSFFDKSRANAQTAALKRTEQMLNEGADIIDVGAQSTRPGANYLSADEEWQRLENLLPSLLQQFPEAVFSIDTFHSMVAKKAVQSGVKLVNDVSGGTLDDNMFATVAQLQVPYILMHMRGTPQNMMQKATYQNLLQEVISELQTKVLKLRQLGLNDIILDPGFGFAKTVAQNFQLLRQLHFFDVTENPILVGISRKSMLTRTLNVEAKNALNGTTALHAWALQNGANLLRVHDVKEAKQVVNLHQMYCA